MRETHAPREIYAKEWHYDACACTLFVVAYLPFLRLLAPSKSAKSWALPSLEPLAAADCTCKFPMFNTDYRLLIRLSTHCGRRKMMSLPSLGIRPIVELRTWRASATAGDAR